MSDTDAILNAVQTVGNQVNDLGQRMNNVEQAILTMARIEERHTVLDEDTKENAKDIKEIKAVQATHDNSITSLLFSRKVAGWAVGVLTSPALIYAGTRLFGV